MVATTRSCKATFAQMREATHRSNKIGLPQGTPERKQHIIGRRLAAIGHLSKLRVGWDCHHAEERYSASVLYLGRSERLAFEQVGTTALRNCAWEQGASTNSRHRS